jgi:hypothetical protein
MRNASSSKPLTPADNDGIPPSAPKINTDTRELGIMGITAMTIESMGSE